MGDFDGIVNILEGKNEDASPIKIETESSNKKPERFSRHYVEDTVLFIDNNTKFQKELKNEFKKTRYSVESYYDFPNVNKLAFGYSAAILEIDLDEKIMRGPKFYNILIDSHLVKNFVFVTKANPFDLIYFNGGYESHPIYKWVNNFKDHVQDKGGIFIYKNPLFLPSNLQEIPISQLVVKLMYEQGFLEKK